MSSKIAVCGSTMYSDVDDQRFQSCLRFLRRCQEGKISVFLGDASPEADVLALMRGAGAFIVDATGKKMHEQKALGLQAAYDSGATVILVTELEKDDLVPNLGGLSALIAEGDAALVVPGRSSASWETYPSEMLRVEGYALSEIRLVTGRGDLDLMFGPFLIHRDQAPRFIASEKEKWSWLHYERLKMIKEGLPCVGIDVDFAYPEAQKAAEEGNPQFLAKRYAQLPYMLGSLAEVFLS